MSRSYPSLSDALNTRLFFLPRFSVLLAALIVVMAAGAANAVSLTVGVDGEAPYDPAAIKRLDPGETAILRVYLNLEGEEVASVFQADFDLVMSGSWDVDLDFTSGDTESEVNVVLPPNGVGTWVHTEGNLTSSLASISLTSENTGGERLVARLDIARLSNNPDDLFEVLLTSDPDRLIVGMDIEGDVERMELTNPPLGSRLFATPEPSTGVLLAFGLIGLAVQRRRGAE